MRNVDPIRTEVYVHRADSFFNAMRLLADDLQTYDAAIALLAVHAVISLNDAIQIGLSGKRSKFENHRQTISDLEGICRSNGIIDIRGIGHLKWLLSHKTAISYGDRRFIDTAVAKDRAERFRTWAYISFREVLRVQEHPY